MKVTKVAGFTAYGAASGFVLSGVGGAVLHAAHHQGADGVLDDAIVGAAGGAVVNALAGAISAFSPPRGLRHDLVDLATSTLAVGALGGLVGAYVLHDFGDNAHAHLKHEFFAGAVGTGISAVVGAAAWSVLCACRCALCCCPGPEHAVARLQAWVRPGYRPVSTEELAEAEI